jgi:sugar phosphate isomerase/epimerase
MRPQVGFVTQLGMGHEEAIAFAGEAEFDYVEVMMDGAGERRRLAERTEDLREALSAADVDLLVHLPFHGINPGSPFEHVREGAVRELEAALEAAADLGARKAVAHATAAAWGPAWDDDVLHERLFESIERLDAVADDRGIELCVENVPGGAFDTNDFQELFEATSASATLDTGHARMHGRDSGGIAAFVDDYGDRISHVHLNDTRVPRDEHLPFGAGTLDFERILGAFPDDWEGTLSLEVFTRDFEYLETSRERLARVLQ